MNYLYDNWREYRTDQFLNQEVKTVRHYYDSFEEEYQEEFCDGCQFHKKYLDWDEGGPDIAGGMAAQRVMVHECLYRTPRAHKGAICPIVAHKEVNQRMKEYEEASHGE